MGKVRIGGFNRKNIPIEKQLENLSDALIENIINTPDKEILDEVEEDYGDRYYIANKMKTILEEAKRTVEQNDRK